MFYKVGGLILPEFRTYNQSAVSKTRAMTYDRP